MPPGVIAVAAQAPHPVARARRASCVAQRRMAATGRPRRPPDARSDTPSAPVEPPRTNWRRRLARAGGGRGHPWRRAMAMARPSTPFAPAMHAPPARTAPPRSPRPPTMSTPKTVAARVDVDESGPGESSIRRAHRGSWPRTAATTAFRSSRKPHSPAPYRWFGACRRVASDPVCRGTCRWRWPCPCVVRTHRRLQPPPWPQPPAR